jgi:hypothetical protein
MYEVKMAGWAIPSQFCRTDTCLCVYGRKNGDPVFCYILLIGYQDDQHGID